MSVILNFLNSKTQRVKFLFHYAWACLRMNAVRALEFKTNTITDLSTDLIWYAIQWTILRTVFNNLGHVGGLQHKDYMTFLGFLMLVDVNANLFTAPLSETLKNTVYNGEFDFILVRPLPILWQLFFCRINVKSILTLLVALGYWIYLIFFIGLNYPLSQWLSAGLALLFGFFIQLMLTLIISSAVFWSKSAGYIGWILHELNQFGTRPEGMYTKRVRLIFYSAVPVLLLASWPCYLLIGKFPVNEQHFWPVAVLLIFAVISRTLWLRGLARYEGLGF